MPNPEWGTKRLCPACATRFYDLGNDPTTCPSCGAEHELSAFTLTKARNARTDAAAKKAKEAEAAAAATEEDDVIDDDDDDLADDVLDDDTDDASDIEEIADASSDDDKDDT